MTKSYPAVTQAVFRGDAAEVKRLLERGESPDAVDANGRTPLMHAAIDGHLEVAKALLRGGAQVNLTDASGWTALHFAAQQYRVEFVNLLLGSGAEVDATDRFGNTPLWRAVFESRGRGGVIKALVSGGADKTKPNAKGVTPIELARRIANYNVKQFLEE